MDAVGDWHTGAHPRAGGDGPPSHFIRSAWLGSPPRGRGRPLFDAANAALAGLTPARAGTALASHLARAFAEAHPRAGGDGSGQAAQNTTEAGSPPRGRGRRYASGGNSTQDGLTPARAGTAGRPRGASPARRAHPRAGGDGELVSIREIQKYGSPPRGRGRLVITATFPLRFGLTPARAGTAACLERRSTERGAHPRAGGDGVAGGELDPRPMGLTPARAGTAPCRSTAPSPRWAHPRAGGDGIATPLMCGALAGSPPRGRGRHALDSGVSNPHGLTPARAGTATPTPGCGS